MEKRQDLLCVNYCYNFLVLDEPTNHLDIISKEVLKNALQEYTGTLLLVSHDRDFLDGLSDRLYYIQNNNISIYFESVKERLEKIAKENADTSKGSKISTTKKKKKVLSENDSRNLNKTLDKLKKNIARVEKNIDKLESKIAEKEAEVNTIDFSKEPNHPIFGELDVLRADLEQEMTTWEALEAEKEVIMQGLTE